MAKRVKNLSFSNQTVFLGDEEVEFDENGIGTLEDEEYATTLVRDVADFTFDEEGKLADKDPEDEPVDDEPEEAAPEGEAEEPEGETEEPEAETGETEEETDENEDTSEEQTDTTEGSTEEPKGESAAKPKRAAKAAK